MRTSSETLGPAYVTLKARPTRIGVLVPNVPGLPWQAVFAGALASLTRVWGGSSCLLVPMPGGLSDELFWTLADLWDPDVYEAFVPSYRLLEDLDPAQYRRLRAELDRSLGEIPGGLEPDAQADALAEPLIEQAISPDLARDLVRRVAPFHFQNAILPRGPLTGSGSPPYPATDALELRPFPEEVLDPVADTGSTAKLLLAATLGALTPEIRERLTREGVHLRKTSASSRHVFLRWMYSLESPGGTSPVDLAENGLAWFQPIPGTRSAITVVVGEDPWDFALAYALRRATSLAYWFPMSFFQTAGERASAVGHLTSLAARTGFPLVISSASDEGGAAALAQEAGRMARRNVAVELVGWRETLPARMNRLLVLDSVGSPEPLYLEQGLTPALRTPIPSTVEPTGVQHLRWVTEAEVRDWGAARHAVLGAGLLYPGDTTYSRTTTEGVAYASPHWAVRFEVPLEFQTQRPSLRPLGLLDQLQTVAASAGWAVELSEKGQFALAAADLYGGVDQLCKALLATDTQLLLTTYISAEEEAPGWRLSDRRRYLEFEDLGALGLHRPASDLLRELVNRGVLHRGLILKCPRCRYTAWYRARDTDPTFTCSRCSAIHRADDAGWLGAAEPAWRYRLDEVVFQFLRHRGDLAVLAAFERFEASPRPVQFVPEILITDPSGNVREIDFAATVGHKLWLGEAFTDPRYKLKGGTREETKRLRRLAEVADLLNARGVILATAAESLDNGTRGRAEAVFSTPWPQLLVQERGRLVPRPTKMLEQN